MPPRQKLPAKRKKPSSGPPMSRTFISREAQTRYMTSLSRRKLIPERGIVNPIDEVKQTIVQKGWEELVKHPGPAVVPVVSEFYANASEHRNKKTWVRGTWVPFDSATINRFYNLPENVDRDYLVWLEDKDVDYDRVLRNLAHSGTEWVMSKGKPKSIPRNGLTTPSKIWHYFIASKLMPSMHVAGAGKERAFLNFVIQKGWQFDVGRVIEASILSMARLSTPTGGFGHPSLIFALCEQAGVAMGSSDEVVQPQSAISPDLVRTFKGPPSSSGVGTSRAPPSSSQQRQQSSSAAASDNMSKRVDELSRRVDRMVELNTLQYQHLLQCIGSSRSDSSTPLPEAPRFPSYPPGAEGDADEDTDEDAEEDSEEGSEDANSGEDGSEEEDSADGASESDDDA